MPTPHNEAPQGAFAKTVIMPGDPLRAEYIAETFLEEANLINQIRGMYAYTGKYQGKEISVMAHGMGIPSMGIYSYELFKEYGVENIIRVGSCGGYDKNLGLRDIVLSERVYSESNYALTLNNEECHMVFADEMLNQKIKETAQKLGTKLTIGDIITSDCFGPYMFEETKFWQRIPQSVHPLAIEMEAFALFYNAKVLGKKAACIMNVVDSASNQEIVSPEERQTGLNDMIRLALETGIRTW